jgi:nucleotide-binding universal stress UspA family protein
MLEYRVRRLPAAMRAARAQKRVGARFPWESARSGHDVTPDHALTENGELVPILTGPLEEHIIADVAWAAAGYIDWTGDETFAALDETIRLAHRRGLEVLVLHVHSPATVPAFSNHEPHATLAWEREFLTRHISTPHDRITLLRRLGVPADDVVAVARETGPDLILIVLAWSQDLAPGHARVVSETLAHADIPVLLLPVQ